MAINHSDEYSEKDDKNAKYDNGDIEKRDSTVWEERPLKSLRFVLETDLASDPR